MTTPHRRSQTLGVRGARSFRICQRLSLRFRRHSEGLTHAAAFSMALISRKVRLEAGGALVGVVVVDNMRKTLHAKLCAKLSTRELPYWLIVPYLGFRGPGSLQKHLSL